MNIEDINKLATLLNKCKDTSSDEGTFTSKDLANHLKFLKQINIINDMTQEGISINLFQQPICIYKTKVDCIKYFQSNVTNQIIVIESNIYYSDKSTDSDVFFENLIYSQKIQKLLEDKEVMSFNDKINKKYYFLSEKNGKIEIGYKNKASNFYEDNYNLKKMYYILKDNLSKEYISFFRDNVIKSVEDEKENDDRFFYMLRNLELIVEKTDREYKLFLNKFSFEEFNSKLEEERDKYFKNLQDSLSDFLSKVNSLPIQFGVYIYLLFRFEKNIYPLLIVSAIIVIWSLFSYFSIYTMKKSIKNLSKRFDNVFKKIADKSGIDLEVLEKEKEDVINRLGNIKLLTTLYQIVVVIFTLGFVKLAYYFIIQINPQWFIEAISWIKF